jgi:hypothetical protein
MLRSGITGLFSSLILAFQGASILISIPVALICTDTNSVEFLFSPDPYQHLLFLFLMIPFWLGWGGISM